MVKIDDRITIVFLLQDLNEAFSFQSHENCTISVVEMENILSLVQFYQRLTSCGYTAMCTVSVRGRRLLSLNKTK